MLDLIKFEILYKEKRYTCLCVKNAVFCEKEEIKAHLDDLAYMQVIPSTPHICRKVVRNNVFLPRSMTHPCDPSTLEAEARGRSQVETSLCSTVRLCLLCKAKELHDLVS